MQIVFPNPSAFRTTLQNFTESQTLSVFFSSISTVITFLCHAHFVSCVSLSYISGKMNEKLHEVPDSAHVKEN